MSLTLPWRNITCTRFRSLLIIIAITISVALETGTAITIDSLNADFIERRRGDNYTDITIHPKLNSSIEDIKNLAEDVRSIKGVKKVSPVVTFTVLKNSSGLEDISNNIVLYGMKSESHPDYIDLQLVKGNLLLEPTDVIISESIAKVLKIDIGDKFSLPNITQFDFGGGNVTLSGVLDDTSQYGNYIGYFFILIDLDYLISLFTLEEHINYHLAVMVKNFININSVSEEIKNSLGIDYEVYREKPIKETDILAIQSYQTAMNLVIIASFIVAFLFITNVILINLRERNKEFGILRAVGSSTRQIVYFISIELLIYGGIASFFGIIIGIVFSMISVLFLDLYFPSIGMKTVTIIPLTIFISYVIGIFSALLAGIYPIYKAKSLPVVQNIHWRVERISKTKRRYWFYCLIIGTLLILAGFITIESVGPSSFLTFNIYSWHFFVIWSIFLGIFLLEIGLLHFLPTIGRKIMFWHRTVPRTISTRNLERNSQKSTITIMVTALALSFILMMNFSSTAIIESVPSYYAGLYGRIDIIAETKDDAQVSLSFVDDLVANNSNIARAEFMQQQKTKIGNADGYVFGVDPDSFDYFLNETILNPAKPNIRTLLNATEKGAIISDLLLSRIGARIGENLSFMISSNSSINVKITGITRSNPFLKHGQYLYISNALYQDFWTNDTANWFIMEIKSDSEPVNIVTLQIIEMYPSLSEVIPIDFYAKGIKNSLSFQIAFFQILIAFTFILASLAQFLNIFMSILKMKREIGVMRSMGLTEMNVIAIYSAESTLLGTTGVIFGVINGLIGSELIVWYISFSIPIQASINVGIILFWGILSLVISIVSSEIASRRSMNVPISHSIKGEGYSQQKMKIAWHDWDSHSFDKLNQDHK